ncbi:MAG: OadG family transporter subunit [Pseudomonadota bacterium]
MIETGAMLAIVGMGIVFVFLSLLVLLVRFSSKVLASNTAAELAEEEAQAFGAGDEQGRIIAAISAAIALYRVNRS